MPSNPCFQHRSGKIRSNHAHHGTGYGFFDKDQDSQPYHWHRRLKRENAPQTSQNQDDLHRPNTQKFTGVSTRPHDPGSLTPAPTTQTTKKLNQTEDENAQVLIWPKQESWVVAQEMYGIMHATDTDRHQHRHWHGKGTTTGTTTGTK